jgi:hypothetical protein
MADGSDSVIEIFGSGNDANFHAQEVDGNVATVDLGKTDGILFGGENRLGAALEAAIDHIDDLLLRVAVVIRVSFAVDDVGAKSAQAVFETFGRGDAGDGRDIEVDEPLEIVAFAGKDVLQIQRMVSALDDFGCLIELPDGAAEPVGAVLAGFGDKDIAGAFEVGDRLAERATREQVVIAERVVAVDEADVQPAFQGEVLEAVVEQERVAAEALDGVPAGFDAILVDQHHNVFEIGGEHVGFIAGLFAVEQQRLSVGDYFGRDFVFLEHDLGDNPLPERTWCALVAARKNCDAAARLLQGARKDFDNRRFTGPANREIANADNLTTECMIPENTVLPEQEPELDGRRVNAGQALKKRAGQPRAEVTAASKDDVEHVLLDNFSPLPHVWP